jgi:hypothetical protein
MSRDRIRVREYVLAAKRDDPVFLTDLRDHLQARADTEDVTCLLERADGGVRRFSVPVPPIAPLAPDERELLTRFLQADLYNHLTTLGGTRLRCFAGEHNQSLYALVKEVVEAFQVDRPSRARTGFGRVVNVLDRVAQALSGDDRALFRMMVVQEDAPSPTSPEWRPCAEPGPAALGSVPRGLEQRAVCGIDVGGTIIKAALCYRGELVALKAYHWNPASYENVEQVIAPIVAIARLMRAIAAVHSSGREGDEELSGPVSSALQSEASCAEMDRASAMIEQALPEVSEALDGIGLSYPDVVIRNRVVGGEVPKTLAMRRNPGRDFDEQFEKLRDLTGTLGNFCRNGIVAATNDGPMAAFTAAVETASSADEALVRSGVFAHTLGTDLGTGIVLSDGSVPEVPLEVYNLVIDVGSNVSRGLAPEDVRSIANTNTGVCGTLQRLPSQAGAFRQAVRLFEAKRNDLLDSLVQAGLLAWDRGGTLVVPESPVDQRRRLLSHLMRLAESEDEAAEVFRRVGEFVGIVWRETERILRTGLEERFLFGGFMTSSRCYELVQEGARRRSTSLRLIRADSSIAYTPLMRQLDSREGYSVAQFGQAIGAIHYANRALTVKPE